MQASGFVLAGGASKRMGQDKALLPYRGTTLVEHVAKTVREAAGSVALIGDPARLGQLGLPVFPDELPSCGPASGIYTALRVYRDGLESGRGVRYAGRIRGDPARAAWYGGDVGAQLRGRRGILRPA